MQFRECLLDNQRPYLFRVNEVPASRDRAVVKARVARNAGVDYGGVPLAFKIKLDPKETNITAIIHNDVLY